MKWNKRNIILIVELSLIAIPVSLLFIIGLYGLLTSVFTYPSIANIIVLIVGFITAAAIISLWVMSYKTIKEKDTKIIKEPYLWGLILVGVLIAISALISSYLPESMYYSLAYDIRQDFELFNLGLPLILVAFHIYYESKKC